jgi:hypothetical protein
MVVGVNDLAIVGRLGVTASISAAVQVAPPTQVKAAFVLDKPAGTEIEAVLVICVCACAIWGNAAESKKPSTSDSVLNALNMENRKVKRLNAFAITDKRTPNTICIVVISDTS